MRSVKVKRARTCWMKLYFLFLSSKSSCGGRAAAFPVVYAPAKHRGMCVMGHITPKDRDAIREDEGLLRGG